MTAGRSTVFSLCNSALTRSAPRTVIGILLMSKPAGKSETGSASALPVRQV
jgi:hypothetical protein